MDSKLRDLAAEKKSLLGRLDSLRAISSDNLDPEVILQQGRDALQDLARLMEYIRTGENHFSLAFTYAWLSASDQTGARGFLTYLRREIERQKQSNLY